MKGLVQGLLVAAGLATGLAVLEQLRDPTSWLRTHGLERLEELVEKVKNFDMEEEW